MTGGHGRRSSYVGWRVRGEGHESRLPNRSDALLEKVKQWRDLFLVDGYRNMNAFDGDCRI